MNIDELIENFELLDDWEDKYRYIIDLGNGLEPLDEQFKTEECARLPVSGLAAAVPAGG